MCSDLTCYWLASGSGKQSGKRNSLEASLVSALLLQDTFLPQFLMIHPRDYIIRPYICSSFVPFLHASRCYNLFIWCHFFLRGMKTSIDSLKLAVSWKGSQIPGAKFTVKVCVHSVLRLKGENILCAILWLLHQVSANK